MTGGGTPPHEEMPSLEVARPDRIGSRRGASLGMLELHTVFMLVELKSRSLVAWA
jgi:hypothetical protein